MQQQAQHIRQKKEYHQSHVKLSLALGSGVGLGTHLLLERLLGVLRLEGLLLLLLVFFFGDVLPPFDPLEGFVDFPPPLEAFVVPFPPLEVPFVVPLDSFDVPVFEAFPPDSDDLVVFEPFPFPFAVVEAA